MPTMRKPSCSKMRPMPGQQMIVAAAKRRHDMAHDAKRSPVEPDLRQRRPRQAADEDQVAAAFAAKQSCRLADLADRNPVMAEARDAPGIAGAFQRENDRRRCRARQANPRPRTASRRPPAITPTGEEISEAADVMAAAIPDLHCLLPSSAGRHSARCLPSPMKARISAIAGSSFAIGCTAFSRSAKMPGP